MFLDTLNLTVKAGDGGKGLVHFRREKYIPKGGPDGGNGGKGGDFYLIADHHFNTFASYSGKKSFKAVNGLSGEEKNRNGAIGEDFYLPMPLGTIVYNEETGEKIGELLNSGDRLLLLEGGRGWYGNAHFTSSTRQTPRFAELGEPVKPLDIKLELKLLADVGIIGIPSSGKSTLISHVSNSKAKIGDYPFTTLVPNIGVVKYQDKSCVMADVPGLIAGASQGKWLGIKFLKHVERTKILIHLLDCYQPTFEDIYQSYETINEELSKYSDFLKNKKQVVVINKIDVLPPEKLIELKSFFTEKGLEKVFFISGVSGQGVEELLGEVFLELEQERIEEQKALETEDNQEEHKIWRPHLETSTKNFSVELEEEGVFRVKWKRIEQIAIMTDGDSPEGMQRLTDVVQKMNIDKELKRHKSKRGDKVLIADKFLKIGFENAVLIDYEDEE